MSADTRAPAAGWRRPGDRVRMTVTDSPMIPSVRERGYAALVRAVFEAGLHPSVVATRWPAFTEAFAGFDPQVAASLDDARVAAMARDARLVRNRSKLQASVANAQRLLALESEHGSLEAWLATLGDRQAVLVALQEHFVRVGPSVAERILELLGPPVLPKS